MSNPIRPFPAYRKHNTGQAFVTVNGRDFYLGEFKSAESYERYNQLQFEWMANGRMLSDSKDKFAVVQIAAAYKEFAKSYYVKNGQVTREFGCIKEAIKALSNLYGRSVQMTLGPLKLQSLRQWMIECG